MEYLRKLFTACLIFSLTLVQFAQGQGYESIFGDSSTSWKVMTLIPGAGMYIDSVSTQNDTIINGKRYKDLKYYNPNIKEFVREDTSKGKAWFLNGNGETLIFDISLTANDSFLIDSNFKRFDYGWQKVDTVFQRSGRKYIQIICDGPNQDTLQFIEGIGPNIGPNPRLSIRYLICSYKNHRLVYFNQDPLQYIRRRLDEVDTMFEKCPKRGPFYTSIKRSKKESEVNVYPNPATKQMQIEFTNQSQNAVKLKIFNRTGQMVLSKQTSGNAFQIQRPGQAGMYFYHLLTSKGQLINSGKLLFVE